jgi:hypothetical protein
LIYLPYYYFDLVLSDAAESRTVRLAVDGVIGNAVLFVDADLSHAPVDIEPICPFRLAPDAAERTALRQYRWMLLEHRLRTRGSVTIRDISAAKRMYYPLWVAYFRRRKAYDFSSVDGVSGELQGVKMRRVILSALRQTTGVRRDSDIACEVDACSTS